MNLSASTWRLSQDFDVRGYRFAERLQLLDDPGELTAGGDPRKEQGRTLHEIVAFKPIT